MADEETTETNEEPQAAAEETPAAEAEETAAPAAEAEGESEAEAVAPPEEPAEPREVLHPKEVRRRARSLHKGEHRATRTPEERQDEREQARARKAGLRRAERAKKRAAKTASPQGTGTAPVERQAGNPQVRQGIVVSDKADKTITVRVDVSRRHRRYKKIVRSSKTLHAHDELNEAHEGDLVRVIEARPLSRTKRWRLTEVLERAR